VVTRRLIAKLLAAAAVGGAAQAPSRPPQRIVSTAPSITETLFALGLGDRVAGVTTFCRYPSEAARKPKIGNYLRPDVEAILALRPDLVIAERSMIRQTLALPGFKLRLLEVDDQTVDGILRSIRAIGEATGAASRAETLCAGIQASLRATRERTAPLGRRSVLFVVGRTPGRLEDIIAAGGGSYIDELIQAAGGKNVFGAAAVPYAKVNLEEVLARDPEVIIDIGEMAQAAEVTPAQQREVLRLWQRYPALRAARSQRVYAVTPDVFVVPGPRVAEAARQLARLLHPEAGL